MKETENHRIKTTFIENIFPKYNIVCQLYFNEKIKCIPALIYSTELFLIISLIKLY